MNKFSNLTSIPSYLPLQNIDTDMIIPKQFLKTIKRTGLGKSLFYEMRYDENGKLMKDFILPIKISEQIISELSEYSKRKKEIKVDLENQQISFGNKTVKFELDNFKKKCLIEGLDDIDLSMQKINHVDNFEKKMSLDKPWIFLNE